MIFRGSFLPGKRSVARTVHKVALPGACAPRGLLQPAHARTRQRATSALGGALWTHTGTEVIF
jgi:hypothetical protein